MIQTDLASLRNRLVKAGIGHELASHPTKGSFLAALLGQRLAGDEPSTKEAAAAAGISEATHRKWKERSPAYAQVEYRARFGVTEGIPIPEDAPPEPEKIQQLRDRLAHAVWVCSEMGVGPWNLKTRFQRETATSAYAASRQIAIETIAELRSYGVNDRLPPEPPPANPYPKVRRHTPIHDTRGYLWPVSINPQPMPREGADRDRLGLDPRRRASRAPGDGPGSRRTGRRSVGLFPRGSDIRVGEAGRDHEEGRGPAPPPRGSAVRRIPRGQARRAEEGSRRSRADARRVRQVPNAGPPPPRPSPRPRPGERGPHQGCAGRGRHQGAGGRARDPTAVHQGQRRPTPEPRRRRRDDPHPLREAVAKADVQQRDTGVADTSFAVQKARRDLAAAEAEFSPVTDEMAYRRRDARNAVLTRDREVRVAMRMREEALPRWKAEAARLMGMLNDRNQSGRVDLAELRSAQNAVDMLEKAKANNTPVGKDEIEAARERIAAQSNIVPVAPNAVEIKSW